MFAPDFIAQTTNHHQQVAAAPITVRSFLQPSPWVLVPNGSFNGYFDWVDPKLRVGRWSVGACIAFPLIVASLFVYMPASVMSATIASFNSPPLFKRYWYYNVAASIWMAFVLGRNIYQEGWVVPFTTFTVWAWVMLLIRHALSAFVIPVVVGGSRLGELTILIAEALRVPSLLNAVVVFVVWNLMLAPAIYLTMETPEKQKQFVGWLFQFNLLNQHGLNLPLAVASSIITGPRAFADADLWFAMLTLVVYFAFYLLVLDRVGVHLYPIFSPRPSYSVVIWFAVAVGYYGLFRWVQSRVLEYLTYRS